MRVLFCKTAYMKYYKGVVKEGPEKDEPVNGGTYIKENGTGGEIYNFDSVPWEDGEEVCLGFVETKGTSTRGKANALHIEKIEGCGSLKEKDAAEDVLVIWCATLERGEAAVMGWYRHATVYRSYQKINKHDEHIKSYNVFAKKEDCVLLPFRKRTWNGWTVPAARKNGYGFGQSLVWYPAEDMEKPMVRKILQNIEAYDGENDIDKAPKTE